MSVWRWLHRHTLWLYYWPQTCHGIHILNSGDTRDPVQLCIMCPQVYKKCRCHLNILGARKQTWSKFHAEDPQIFGASHIKFSTPSNLEPEIFCIWSLRVTTDKLFYIGTINWSYRQTLLYPQSLPNGRWGSLGLFSWKLQSAGLVSITNLMHSSFIL